MLYKRICGKSDKKQTSVYLIKRKIKMKMLVYVPGTYMIPGAYYAPDTYVRTYVVVRMIPTFRPWTHTSDDSYIYQLSPVVATATVSFNIDVQNFLLFRYRVVVHFTEKYVLQLTPFCPRNGSTVHLHRAGSLGIKSCRHDHARGSLRVSCCCNESVGLNWHMLFSLYVEVWELQLDYPSAGG